MRDIRINLKPFVFLSVLSCNLKKRLNDHTLLSFEGRISAEQEEILLTSSMKQLSVSLEIADEGEQFKTIFCGIVKDFAIKTVGDSKVLRLICISNTYLMDNIKKVRVFQNKSSSYHDVLKNLNTYDNYGFIMSEGETENIKKLIVQYNETDWEFIKRLASHFNTSICPAHLTQGEKYYFGIPRSATSFELDSDYILKREVKEDLRKDEKELSFSIDVGNSYIEMQSREVYEMGAFSTFNGQVFVVCEIYSNLIGNELIHTYILKEQLGQYVAKYYNSKIIGASLAASISSVSNSKVKVSVHEYGIQDNIDWFNYSTVYSSPDGTGWYCMPENGDSVRLYFPTEKEQHGYIISAVHIDEEFGGGQAEPPRSNPDNKSLKSKYGKELLFTPTSVVFTNNNGMTVELVDGKGVSISSDKAININSEEQIDMVSNVNSINLNGAEAINFKQVDTAIEIKETIKTSGSKVQME